MIALYHERAFRAKGYHERIMETMRHSNLKRLALAFLAAEYGSAFVAAATEVRCPIARFRIDVVGCLRTAGKWLTLAIECKQSRADFLSDRSEPHPLLEEQLALRGIVESVQRHRVPRLEPHLRRAGTSLFPELDEWDFSASRLDGYLRMAKRLARMEARRRTQIKFALMSRYRSADLLYLAAPCGMIHPREVPQGWGLLECAECALDASANPEAIGSLIIRVEAPRQRSRPTHQRRLLRNVMRRTDDQACRATLDALLHPLFSPSR
jgi:hypothetical protein